MVVYVVDPVTGSPPSVPPRAASPCKLFNFRKLAVDFLLLLPSGPLNAGDPLGVRLLSKVAVCFEQPSRRISVSVVTQGNWTFRLWVVRDVLEVVDYTVSGNLGRQFEQEI